MVPPGIVFRNGDGVERNLAGGGMHSYLPTGSTDPSKCRATAGLAESIIIANRPTSRLHRECVRTRTRVPAQLEITSQSDSVFAQKMCLQIGRTLARIRVRTE